MEVLATNTVMYRVNVPPRHYPAFSWERIMGLENDYPFRVPVAESFIIESPTEKDRPCSRAMLNEVSVLPGRRRHCLPPCLHDCLTVERGSLGTVG